MEKFRDYLLIKRRLSPRTVKDSILIAKRFLEHSDNIVSSETIKSYFKEYIDNEPWTYNTQLVRLRRFIRDYLDLEELIEDYKAAPIDILSKPEVPTLENLRAGYEALDNQLDKLYFLFLSTTGLRRGEVLRCTKDKIYPEIRAVIPEHYSRTKRSGVTFYNEETEALLMPHIKQIGDCPIFKEISDRRNRKIWNKVSESAGIRITPQVLRVWFSTELGERMVPDRFIDIFQGRAPRSTLGRYYTGRDLMRLKRIYDNANLMIL